MAGRFVNPYPQFEDSTPAVYSGGGLYFYATGTSTPQNTYTTKALSVANPNPIVLNSAGRPAVDIYLQDLEYKVVLKDASNNVIWTADPVSHRDQGLVAKTVTGSGSPNGAVAGTQGSASVLPDFYWDFTNAILYVCTTTGNAAAAVWTAVNASSAAAIVHPPQGYLTLISGVKVITSDAISAGAVYYTPDVGNTVPIYNGSSFIPTVFTEQTLALVASHAASNIYDVFMFNNSGVPTLVTGPSWSAGSGGSITAGSCARGTGAGGTALSRVSGILTNSVQITGRNGATTYTIGANLATYLGSIFMDGTNGQTSCHVSYGTARKWGVWNAYNRVSIQLKSGDPTNYAYVTSTLRQVRGAANTVVTIFCGLADEIFNLNYAATLSPVNLTNNTTTGGLVAIGYNSITTPSGRYGQISFSNSSGGTVVYMPGVVEAKYLAPPAIGINTINALENGLGVTTNSWNAAGSELNVVLSAQWRG